LKKRILIAIAVLLVVITASFSTPSASASGVGFLASFDTNTNNPHFAVLGISLANLSDTGQLATAYTNYCLGCSTVSIPSISVLVGQTYLVLVSVNTSSSSCGGLSDTLRQTFTPTAAAHSSTGHATVCAYNEGSITSSGMDAISVTDLSLNYNIEVYVYVLTGYSNGTLGYNSADDATCSCSPTIPQLYFNYVSVNPGWFGAGAYDSTALTTVQLTYEAGTTGIGEGVSGGQYAGFGGEYFINTGPITSTVTTTTPITTTTTSAVTTTAPGPCCVQVQGGGVQTTTAISTTTVSASTLTQVRSSSVKSILTIFELSSSEWFVAIIAVAIAVLASVVVVIRVRTRHF